MFASALWNRVPQATESAVTADRKVRPRGKVSNAFKHGIFSTIAILPGENMEDFAALGTALFSEWDPDGPTETDAVFTIAKCMWRKIRIQKFMYGKIAIRQFTPSHPAFDPELA